MRSLSIALSIVALFVPSFTFAAQGAAQGGAQSAPQAAPQSGTSQESSLGRAVDADAALQKALADAGNDAAAVVRNLEDYLVHFPDAPRAPDVYRAIVEACEQLGDNPCALNYAERLIAVRPGDSDVMMLAITLLQQQGDDASLTRAAGYATRVLDQIEKATPDQKPSRESMADWQKRQADLRAALYCLRGQIENSQRDYDSATKDLETSYSIEPSSLAAEQLGETAEVHKDYPRAIQEYLLAFALPDTGLAGSPDRRDVRRKLGNVWRQVHGSEQGLGDEILAAYDRLAPMPPVADADPVARNKNAKNIFEFVLTHTDGTPLPLATLKGKIVALSFWATWCGPCRELEPIFDQVAGEYVGNPEVVFLAVSADQDESQVPPFLAHAKWDMPVAYADGLDVFLNVRFLPTVLVLDRSGKIVFSVNGPAPETLPESLTSAIQRALASAP
ncbi:MAG: thioredoxin-like domain-containing protein [Candidatus Acidiferrales bacterium]